MEDTSFKIVLDLSTWAMIGGTLVPIVVGLITKANLHGGVKAVINLVLVAVVGLIGTAQVTDGVLTQETLFTAGIALVTSMAMHFGVWKPMAITGADGLVQQTTKRFGIGPKSPRAAHL